MHRSYDGLFVRVPGMNKDFLNAFSGMFIFTHRKLLVKGQSINKFGRQDKGN